MTRYAMLTDEPERLLRAYGRNGILSVASFGSAVGALVWERGQRGEGTVIFDGPRVALRGRVRSGAPQRRQLACSD